MDTTRVRKAFKYPNDDDDDGEHDEIDEEEQEHLLTQLRASESTTNAQYTLMFTALPLVVSLPFLWYLTLSTSRTMALLCLLSITSLASSSYIMFFVPVSTSSSSSVAERSAPNPNSRAEAARRKFALSDQSPINQYLAYLNASIDALLFLASMAYRSRTNVPEGLWLFLLLPGVMFAMVFMARRSINEISRGLDDLQGLKYEYKGA
ncbi:hypothetical protein LTR10_019775 [Elasticomyces elasticus]|uniref:Lysosomal cobalamin transporter n=1 Tax=Exophiala sideris TaxID=1016849 RepID=A0ABR0JD38_9EURO|nr:hypothetical protein LTR10_019775 [Elasticomyces elasticus]KAK5032097.1 hypothetical protein LTS07_004719 [Exophiala sideris]KAK5041024.1 hypothetical protein LTR13_003326 [Exophiala sideris]KAK5061642.1 hypothetical protein LTR69_004824 [Exophiala sideris]KAK5184341.1 hypothetical protein LTR44_003014 [Eurotiomycetes sp. CCFEE 6388]